MRSFIFSLYFLLSASALASKQSPPDACKQFMTCGNFEGTGKWYNSAGEAVSDDFQEKIQITQLEKDRLNIKIYIFDESNPEKKPWGDFEVAFQASGRFDVIANGDFVVGSGFCNQKVCNVAFRPVSTERGVNAYVNTLRFEDGKLARFNMVSDNSKESEILSQRSSLILK